MENKISETYQLSLVTFVRTFQAYFIKNVFTRKLYFVNGSEDNGEQVYGTQDCLLEGSTRREQFTGNMFTKVLFSIITP
jgi:hypothetical protein